jgi:multiple sugar transport system permease protein
MGDFTYVLFFWLALAALIVGVYLLWRAVRETLLKPGEQAGILFMLPAIVNAVAILLFVQWFSVMLPEVLNIPRRVIGQERVQGLFINELFKSFQVPEIAAAGNLALLVIIIAVAFSAVILWLMKSRKNTALWLLTGAALAIGVGVLVMSLTLDTINTTIEAARTNGTELPIWSQIIMISAGAGLVYAAYRLWGRAVRTSDNRRFIFMSIVAMLLLLGGYLLVAELPRILSNSDKDMLSGFSVTIMYAAGAIPFELSIGLGLAYLLFQNLAGKSFFRMIFFLPYIMPFIATALVFVLLFSQRPDSAINKLVGLVGIPPQKWLLEPQGIGTLIFGPNTPQALAGPGLALVVVIIFTIWTYIGYSTVVFLAGLGNIPSELYEAARIDGASGWAVFRYLTLPLLSPTTFFLSLVAVIGTFQAFTQLWLMRTPASGRSIDTVSIYIFRQLTDANPNYGYGSAVAFVLFGVILVLTIAQNRFAGRRVFYG